MVRSIGMALARRSFVSFPQPNNTSAAVRVILSSVARQHQTSSRSRLFTKQYDEFGDVADLHKTPARPSSASPTTQSLSATSTAPFSSSATTLDPMLDAPVTLSKPRATASSRNLARKIARPAPPSRSLSSSVITSRGNAVYTERGWHLPLAPTTEVDVDGYPHRLAPALLRDLCSCDACIDPSTKQKHFATVDIPANIAIDTAHHTPNDTFRIRWSHDVPGYGPEHRTELPLSTLRTLVAHGQPAYVPTRNPARPVHWSAPAFAAQVRDIDYSAYMSDDEALWQAVRQLQTHGLLFLTNVPSKPSSVATIAQRIGPLKTTFYGETWDVRSTPEAINVAYTSQNLGFHMDLMYMEQPPQVQLLHCIRSSASGGASLFTDSRRALADLARSDLHAFDTLSTLPIDFHYDHAGAHYYHQTRRVIDRSPSSSSSPATSIMDTVTNVNWAPPFQAPFSLAPSSPQPTHTLIQPTSSAESLSSQFTHWHAAAAHFNALIHRPDGIYERLMAPGDCVLFDNRRVLHARRAFAVSDAGTERWLRGAYIDRDPFVSRAKILRDRFEGTGGAPAPASYVVPEF